MTEIDWTHDFTFYDIYHNQRIIDRKAEPEPETRNYGSEWHSNRILWCVVKINGNPLIPSFAIAPKKVNWEPAAFLSSSSKDRQSAISRGRKKPKLNYIWKNAVADTFIPVSKIQLQLMRGTSRFSPMLRSFIQNQSRGNSGAPKQKSISDEPGKKDSITENNPWASNSKEEDKNDPWSLRSQVGLLFTFVLLMIYV